MTRIVLDTNLFISAFLSPHGKPARILAMRASGEIDLLVSPAILKEIALVLGYSKIVQLLKKPGISRDYILEKLQKVIKSAIIIPGSLVVNHIQSDPSDNMILACALEGRADYIVSGDHHLTDLKLFQGIPIVSPDTFLNTLQ
jgi:putative PIN family toxin of toxin-antitoxin system